MEITDFKGVSPERFSSVLIFTYWLSSRYWNLWQGHSYWYWNWDLVRLFLLSSVQFSSVAQSCPALGNPMNCSMPGLPIPSSIPGVHSDSRPSSQWCHPAISSSVVPFSSCPQSLSASESFPMSQLITWGGQSTGVSASASFPPKKSPGLISFRMDWLDLLAVQGTLKSFLQHHSSKASILRRSAFFTIQLSHPYMTTYKTIALTRRTFVGKVMSLLFNMLSRLVITFLPRTYSLSIKKKKKKVY